MQNSIYAQLLRKNAFYYECSHVESVPCDSIVQGVYWRIPTVSMGVHNKQDYTFRSSADKPTVDAVKGLRVYHAASNTFYFIAIADAADGSQFTDLCNQCCGQETDMPLVALPTILLEGSGCEDEAGNFTYFAATLATPPAGSRYMLSGSVNGATLPAAPYNGFATLADLITWGDTNWSAGDLDGLTLVDGTKVVLNAGPTGVEGSINVSLGQSFISNVPGALTTGQNYSMNGTINGTALPNVQSADNEILSILIAKLNNTPSYAKYGKWSEQGGAVAVTSTGLTLSSATLTVTKV